MRLIDAVRNAPLFELMVITGGLVNDFRSAPEKKSHGFWNTVKDTHTFSSCDKKFLLKIIRLNFTLSIIANLFASSILIKALIDIMASFSIFCQFEPRFTGTSIATQCIVTVMMAVSKPFFRFSGESKYTATLAGSLCEAHLVFISHILTFLTWNDLEAR